MLVTIPGSVEVYRAVPRVPSGVAEPELVTTMLRPVKKKGRLGLVGCLFAVCSLLFSLLLLLLYEISRDDGEQKLTLWVGLSAVLLASRVQGNNLVANYVVARCDIGWNGHRRGEVVGYTHTHVGQDRDFRGGGKKGERKSSAHTHHVIAGPDARSSGAIIQTIGLDFDEAEIGLCNIGELASNRCEVGDDRTMVGFRPSVPAKWER